MRKSRRRFLALTLHSWTPGQLSSRARAAPLKALVPLVQVCPSASSPSAELAEAHTCSAILFTRLPDLLVMQYCFVMCVHVKSVDGLCVGRHIRMVCWDASIQ